MDLELILKELWAFELSRFSHSRIESSCTNQLLLQFSMDLFETLHSYCGHYEDLQGDF